VTAGPSRPRVLLLIKGLGLGGAERLLADVVAHRDRSRFDYEVAYVLADQRALVPALEASGVLVHRLGARASTDLRWTARLRRLLVEGRFDVVHAHLPYSAAVGRLVVASLPRRHRPRLVYTEHSLWNKAAILTKALNAVTIGLDDALLVVSDAARDALPARLRGRAQVVVHGIDRTPFEELIETRPAQRVQVRAELGLDDGEVLALTVANLRGEKGYDTLLGAARHLAEAGSPARLVSVGRGPLDASLRAARDAAGLTDRVQFLGLRTDVHRLMAGADVFVLPSHQEGLPVALMEAMSAGLPVVATAVGGVPGVVRDGVEGFIVPPGRDDLMADALERMVRDVELRTRMGVAARERSAQFDVARAVHVIEDTYTRLLAERSR
jgi:glycosyltransferase involved in cell wall biosynthesis